MAGINKLIERVQGWFHNVTRAWKTTSTVTLFGRVFPKRNVVAAGLGILCAVAVAGGAIFAYATTNQSQNGLPLVSVVVGGSVTTDKADTSSEEVASATGVSNAGENATTDPSSEGTATDPASVAETAAAGDSAGSTDSNSSSSSTNAGNGSSASQGSSSAAHTTVHHDAEYTTVHHDAEYENVHHAAEYEYRTIAYDGTDMTDWDMAAIATWQEEQALAGKPAGYGTKAVEVSPAYDEHVLVREAYDEQVLVRDAWDETVTN